MSPQAAASFGQAAEVRQGNNERHHQDLFRQALSGQQLLAEKAVRTVALSDLAARGLLAVVLALLLMVMGVRAVDGSVTAGEVVMLLALVWINTSAAFELAAVVPLWRGTATFLLFLIFLGFNDDCLSDIHIHAPPPHSPAPLPHTYTAHRDRSGGGLGLYLPTWC